MGDFVVNFLLGGFTVAGAAYLGSRGDSYLSVLLIAAPMMTTCTLYALSKTSTPVFMQNYANILLCTVIQWVGFVVAYKVLLNRMPLLFNLGTAVLLYGVVSILVQRVFKF